MIRAGIDEAGYGPVLGPLVAALASFDSDADDLWRTLRSATLRRVPKPGARTARLPVVDSKCLHRGGAGLAELETVALAFSSFVAGSSPPATAFEFLERHRVGPALPIDAYPWYRELTRLEVPLRADRARVLSGRDRLERAAGETGVRPIRVGIAPVLEAEFNERAERYGSKARLLFDLNVTLIEDLRAHGAASFRVICDRHGGRRRYADLLQSAFPMESIAIDGEAAGRSSYRVRGGGREIELVYVVGGEREGFEVALASIFAKYTRELFVEVLNRHFGTRLAGLRRTAGYYTDGLRFLADLDRARVLTADERRRMVRIR